ncbi:DUF4339 domain-containing protein [Flavobacterium frigoris]|uniref:GYF domain-containing protein n=1 Tax=Flavobacterium frigoris (strain PS1) TaxID=1086011 RepID=H7FTQ3_FLAFP|nr:DUF4339 domain-containing protein [Flavobacterium frigoris]EIA08532.1 hypothetical protein HJ01_02254 [Flavobacterium frigoris PS1]
MKTYYLHNGNENEGPFDLEELKSKKISRTTPVWCAGMDDWKTAWEVEELKSLLQTVPPPIKPFITFPSNTEEEEKQMSQKIWGLSITNFFMAAGVFVLVIVILITNNLQENRKTNLEQKNNQTERNNQQYKLQQKEIQEQKNRIAEQESLELERAAKEEKEAISNRILEIKSLLSSNYSKLKELKTELNDAADFQFLRTSEKRIEDIDSAQNNIDDLTNEIAELKREIDLLYLKLEKIR